MGNATDWMWSTGFPLFARILHTVSVPFIYIYVFVVSFCFFFPPLLSKSK